MENRRTIPRWQVGKQVQLQLEGLNLKQNCCLEDINLKGMCVSLPEELPARTTFRINLGLEDNFHIDLEAKLRWNKLDQRRYYYGLEFSHIFFDQDKEKLYSYLNEHYFGQFKDKWWSNKENF